MKYVVDIIFSGTVGVVVEAETETEAKDKAMRSFEKQINNDTLNEFIDAFGADDLRRVI